ncbi:F-box/kelch-repeat protein At1g57790-like [Magnolia sinica]|uniref:F-box/kelch-repeat protein At1g57790-like n=1 Tax=Magnolia sinica TaxID=86752 RepID=UPI00265A723F|nr:F-box/kelch-repeat protein At1g57790-like [Magnolia sinica]
MTPAFWSPSTPWLIFNHNLEGVCKFFDPLNRKNYVSEIPGLSGTVFHHSKGGWLLVSRNDDSVFFFNPFTQEQIDLPNSIGVFWGISFSSPPTSPDCVVFAVHNINPYHISIKTCCPGDMSWKNYSDYETTVPFVVVHNNPVFYEGLFHCLGLGGRLGVFNHRENTWNVLDKPEAVQNETCDCFLTESGGELVMVSVDHLGDPINTFLLDQSKMVWVEVKSLGEQTLFVGHEASLSMKAIRGMENKIYFSRIRGSCSNEPVFYSMETKNGRVEFWKSKVYSNCTWIEPNGYVFESNQNNNELRLIGSR